MKFTASRLSEGNKLFPAEIHVEPNGITVKIPGFFRGQSSFIGFNDIASVNVDTPLIGYSTISFYAHGARVSAHGFTKDEAKQVKRAIEEGKNN